MCERERERQRESEGVCMCAITFNTIVLFDDTHTIVVHCGVDNHSTYIDTYTHTHIIVFHSAYHMVLTIAGPHIHIHTYIHTHTHYCAPQCLQYGFDDCRPTHYAL